MENETPISITVLESIGLDKALVINIDTTFEPDGSDGSVGCRVYLNECMIYEGVKHIVDMERFN